ncbi:dTMP kinase [Streptomyces sp. ODS05-4]|uniref:dTMP kinase n=1 Tax=Streptomyces sp. ODS05-4 TaxID=2944939 RepID=UPI00210B3DBC|nr:dTMP kinase [Streptomyces sp. ODS05-4]
MTRAEQPTVLSQPSDSDAALAADSRERAVRALLRTPPVRRLWSAQLVGGIGDALAMLVLVLLALQAATTAGTFGGGYRGAAFAVAAVFGVRVIATVLFGAVLLGPLTTFTAPGGPLDRRWTMVGADGLRVALLIVAPLWTDWTGGGTAMIYLLATVFLAGAAERVWTVAKESAAPALLPGPPLEGAAVRPLPDHLDALRRLSLRTGFAAVPGAALALLVATLIGNLLGAGVDWFTTHQAALGSYLAAGLFAASVSVLYFLTVPATPTPRPHSPLEGLRRPSAGGTGGKGRTGAIPLLVLACGAVAGAIAAAASVAALHGGDLGGGPVSYALLVLALTGGAGLGIRRAPKTVPGLSRRRLLVLAIAVTGVALLAMGLVPDLATVLFLALAAGFAAGVAAGTGHALLDQEAEDTRRPRLTEHLQAVVRVAVALGAIAAPLLAAAIGPHKLANGDFVFAHGGAAFTLMLVGALLLPVAALLLAKTDDRSGVPLRHDLRDALRGADPVQAPSETGFFIALEGGDGAGKSTQVEALAEWIRGKGHEVVVTREPGATPIGKRLRSILLDVSSAGLSHRAEALLYAADRAEHVDSLVRPALERGAVVITDRYIDSSVAYQGAGRDLSPTEIARISRWATGGLVPDLTVLLDVDPETARERFTEAPDRLESEPAEFHRRVRAGFLTLAAADPGRYLVVDAGRRPEAVTGSVRQRLDRMLPLSEAEKQAIEEARRRAEEEARRKAEEEAARKAEEERLERERQAQLAKLRAEEEERKRREEEEARRLEAERKRQEEEEARLRAEEEARRKAEEAARQAEEERRRLEAEEKARLEEQERLRARKAEEERLRAEAEERRLEKQRKAEEALLRAEEARREAEEEARRQAEADARRRAEEARRQAEAEAEADARRQAEQEEKEAAEARRLAEEEAAEARRVAEAEAEEARRPAEGPSAGPSASETTVPTPVVRPNDVTQEVPVPRHSLRKDEPAPRLSDDTAVLRPVREDEPAPGALDETAVLRPIREDEPRPGAADETAKLPRVRDERDGERGPDDRAADETAVLPPVRQDGPAARAPRSGGRSGDAPADRVPQDFFRKEPHDTAPADTDRPGAGRPSANRPGIGRGDGGPDDGGSGAGGRPGGVRDSGSRKGGRGTSGGPGPSSDPSGTSGPSGSTGTSGNTGPSASSSSSSSSSSVSSSPSVSSGGNERTRELPQLDEQGRPRRRSDWAEETPLDDLPTLADELLGPHADEDESGTGDGGDGRRGRGGRGGRGR